MAKRGQPDDLTVLVDILTRASADETFSLWKATNCDPGARSAFAARDNMHLRRQTIE